MSVLCQVCVNVLKMCFVSGMCYCVNECVLCQVGVIVLRNVNASDCIYLG